MTKLQIVQGGSKISLITLDWFLTNYCNKYNIIIDSNKDSKYNKLIVHFRL